MKKTISYADWTAVGSDNYAVEWFRPMCKYTLIKEAISSRESDAFLFGFIF